VWKQSLKDALLDRIRFAEGRNFTSWEDLDLSLPEEFPVTIFNFSHDMFSKIFICQRVKENRKLPEVLKEWQNFLGKLT